MAYDVVMLKICTKCNRELPATVETFYADRSTGRLRPDCIDCVKRRTSVAARGKKQKRDPEKKRLYNQTYYEKKHGKRSVKISSIAIYSPWEEVLTSEIASIIECDPALINYVDVFDPEVVKHQCRSSQVAKTKAAAPGRLFTIFAHEWRDRRPQIISFIRANLGVFDHRHYARQTDVRVIDHIVAKTFIEQNHIQPVHRIDAACGLFLGDTLIGVVTYAAHHRNSHETVLNRLCFLAGHQVVGGVAKLVTGSLHQCRIRRVITWSDNRWSTGDLYVKLGFTERDAIPPDYLYTNFQVTRSKQSMKKSNTGCPVDVTEVQWGIDHGWFRVWDAGKRRFELWVKG
jgi:hypothetical protein